MVFAPGDAVTEDEAEAEVPGENPPDGGGDDADDHPPDGEEKAGEEEEHEEIPEETQPDEPSWIHRKLGMRLRTMPMTPRALPKILNMPPVVM